MTLMRRIRRHLWPPRGAEWVRSCPAGPPVREASRCNAVDCDSVPLLGLRRGETATVCCLEDPEDPRSWKLAAMGVLPGARIALLQRFPAFVFRIGMAEFAVDEALAEEIRVRRDEPAT